MTQNQMLLDDRKIEDLVLRNGLNVVLGVIKQVIRNAYSDEKKYLSKAEIIQSAIEQIERSGEMENVRTLS